jgi:hypothetical protein
VEPTGKSIDTQINNVYYDFRSNPDKINFDLFIGLKEDYHA